MTTLSQQRAMPGARVEAEPVLRHDAAGLVRIVSRFRSMVKAFAYVGQLGPDRDTEIGRWTGGRV